MAAQAPCSPCSCPGENSLEFRLVGGDIQLGQGAEATISLILSPRRGHYTCSTYGQQHAEALPRCHLSIRLSGHLSTPRGSGGTEVKVSGRGVGPVLSDIFPRPRNVHTSQPLPHKEQWRSSLSKSVFGDLPLTAQNPLR